MPVSPPKALAPKNDLPEDPVAQSLEQEILAEKAATYSRLVQELEKALEALREFEEDAVSENTERSEARPNGRRPVRAPSRRPASGTSGIAGSEKQTAANSDHEALLNAAGRALWYVMIQRDLCGFRRHDLFYKELNVPPSVRLRMGIARSR